MLKRISEWLDSEVFDHLRQKFPTFGELLYWEHQIRKESGSTTRASELGVKDVDPKEKRPWKKLPNIRDFSIKVMPKDWVFLLFGLSKRFEPKLTFHPWVNAPVNKYVDYMFKRLEKQVKLGLYEEAAKTMWLCMNSKAYLAVSVNAVLRNWHRKIPLWEINKYIREVNVLIRTQATNINYSRVYLQEKSKIRPLGVPVVPWRIYLHMYNNLLVQWRMVTESNAQHAYLPGRGVMTAWNQLVNLLKEPNIYEADYTGFFDSVSLFGLNALLINELKLPMSETFFIGQLNRSQVKLPDEHKLPEPSFIDEWKAPIKLRGVPQGAPTSPNLATLCHRVLEKIMKGLYYADDLIIFPKNSKDNPIAILENPRLGLKVKLAKSGWLKKDGKWQVESFKFIGIRYYPPKLLLNKDDLWLLWILCICIDLLALPFPVFTTLCAWVSYRDWNLERPEMFEADTRKGAKLRFWRRESLLSYLLIARDGLNSKYTGKTYKLNYSLKDWLRLNALKWIKIKGKSRLLWNNKYTGWFMARMFLNSWEVNQYQDFNLTFIPNSWMGIVWPEYRIKHNLLGKKKVSVFTASSFACHDLLRLIHDSRLKTKPRKLIKYISVS